MLLSLLGVVGGLAVLTYSADQFVIGAARLSLAHRLSKVVVGAVVIGFGTSAPELLVSTLAGVQGSIDLAVGNIVGSNAANLTLVLGAAALVCPIVVHVDVLKREALLSLGMVLILGFLLQGTTFTAADGLVLAVLFVAALTFIVLDARGGDDRLGQEVDEYLEGGEFVSRREWTRTLLGLAGTVAAAQLLVWSATNLAGRLGLAEGFVGLTVVAVGTSLPELAAALQAARKEETDLIVGNLLGSNLFNSGAVAAVAAFVGTGRSELTISLEAILLMVGAAIVATAFMVTGQRVVRWEGAVLMIVFVATIPLLVG